MTRTPRTSPHSDYLRSLTSRVSEIVNRKTLAYTGAGLALAGTGAAVAMTGFAGGTASAAETSNLHRAAVTATRHQPARQAPAKQAPAKHATKSDATAKHDGASKPATPAKHAAPAKQTAPKSTPAKSAPAKSAPAQHAKTWHAVSQIVAKQTFPKAAPSATLPARDQLTPVATTGPQTWMPMTAARYDNAKAIVKAALDKHMGLRAAVVAVATSMQETTLENINYGTSDSVGLFQQRPSCGWGTVTQIMHPTYAADQFLKALRGYEDRDPAWANQPLWQSAQGVQASGFPTAYAKWEAQAAHLVQGIAKQIV
jgi:hypothetical protein